MKTPKLATLAALASMSFACGADFSGMDDQAITEDDAQSTQEELSVGGFEFDASMLVERPSADIPTLRLGATAFDPRNIGPALMRTSESFRDLSSLGKRRVLESQTWFLESDDTTGQVIASRKLPSGTPRTQDENALRQRALDYLSKWGIGPAELGTVLQRKLMRQDQADTGNSNPVLHRYKTFVRRAQGGIPIEGHRAVITHNPDGTMQRALINWPVLSATGHKLRSRVDATTIQTRAAAALRLDGETQGKAILHWKYVPTVQANGETTLELKVGARMAAARGEFAAEEPRDVDVSVDAY